MRAFIKTWQSPLNRLQQDIDVLQPRNGLRVGKLNTHRSIGRTLTERATGEPVRDTDAL